AEQPASSDAIRVTALRHRRCERGITQRVIAGWIGVDVTTIQRWERTGLAPYRRAQALATALGTTLDALAAPEPGQPKRAHADHALRRLRRSRRLSAAVVAARVDVSISALLAWERGAA